MDEVAIPPEHLEALQLAAAREGLDVHLNAPMEDYSHAGPEGVDMTPAYVDMSPPGPIVPSTGFGAELDEMIEAAVAEYRQQLIDGVREKMAEAIRDVTLLVEDKLYDRAKARVTTPLYDQDQETGDEATE